MKNIVESTIKALLFLKEKIEDWVVILEAYADKRWFDEEEEFRKFNKIQNNDKTKPGN